MYQFMLAGLMDFFFARYCDAVLMALRRLDVLVIAHMVKSTCGVPLHQVT